MILKKALLAFTGLFICFFLIVHLGGNTLLLLPELKARPLYNAYSTALRGNPIIAGVAYFNYACILLHVALAVVLTIKNRQSKGLKNIQSATAQNSSWTSQNMALLGSMLFAFLVIHMANFWYRVKIQGEDQDLYGMVMDLFRNPIYLIIYVVAMLPLSLHLAHGVKSAFKSLGLYHVKYLRWVSFVGVGYAWVIGFGFAVIPVVLYFK